MLLLLKYLLVLLWFLIWLLKIWLTGRSSILLRVRHQLLPLYCCAGGKNYNRSPTHWLQTNSCLLCPPLNIFPVPRWSSSFMMLLTPALLCHKDTAQGTQGPLVQGICHMRPNAVKTQRKAGNAALWLFFYKSPESLARPYKCSMFPPWFCLNSDDNDAPGTRAGHRIYTDYKGSV